MRNLYDHHFALRPGTRVYIPTEYGRGRGREIKANIEAKWKPPSNYFHLLEGGHVAAAQQHRNERWLASVDLERFFDQLTRSKVHRSLKSIGFQHVDAWEMACDSTVDKRPPKRQFSLPFGFVQSPIVASVVLSRSALGGAIRQIGMNGLNITVYVDDITVSGPSRDEVEAAIEQLEIAANLSGFVFKPEKMQLPGSKVSCFNIEFGSGEMSVVADRMTEFEQAIADGNEHRIRGILGYVGSVSPLQANRLAEALL